MKKEEQLQKINPDYLRDFVVNYNNAARYDSFLKDDNSLINFASKKFSKDQVNTILSSYLVNQPPSEIALQMKFKNGKEIAGYFIQGLSTGEIAKKEFSAHSRICDILWLNSANELTAIEVKANGDKIKSALSQLKDYTRWADLVYLMIEEKKLGALNDIDLPDKVGLLVFDGNHFKEEIKARKIEHDVGTFIELMNSKMASSLLGELRLKKSGKLQDLKKRLIAYAQIQDISVFVKRKLFS